MGLSLLEKRVLRFIHTTYPVACNPSESNRVITHKERPIPIGTDIRNRFKRHSEEVVDKAIQRFITFQYVTKVYLAAPEDFSEQPCARAKSSDIGNSDREPEITDTKLRSWVRKSSADLWPKDSSNG